LTRPVCRLAGDDRSSSASVVLPLCSTGGVAAAAEAGEDEEAVGMEREKAVVGVSWSNSGNPGLSDSTLAGLAVVS